MYKEDVSASLPKSAKLPKPQGYKILIAIPQVKEETDGGLLLPDSLRDRETTASILGYVVSMGEDAYKDESKFSEPWCKEGDWIIFRSYSGTRLNIEGSEFRIINDDTVEATVEDPRGYKRA